MRRFAMIMLGVLLMSSTGRAELYRCADESGNPLISDIPCGAAAAGTQAEDALFQANLLIVRSRAEIERWVRLDDSRQKKHAGRLRYVKRGGRIYVPVVVTLPFPQAENGFVLSADLELLSPDGRVYRIAGCCIGIQVDTGAARTIVLEPVLDFVFDDGDPSGEYTVEATISNGSQTVTARERFRLQ